MIESSFDIAVIGLGAVGSSLVRSLALDGIAAIGFDQFHPPHEMGSSHGDTRLTRVANGEGDVYAPMALRSMEIWRELEQESGEELFVGCGAIIIANPDQVAERIVRKNFLRETQSVAERCGIPHEMLDAEEIRYRFPHFGVSDSDRAYYEPGAGYLKPELCISVQLAAAQRAGASLRFGTKVQSIEGRGRRVVITTDNESLEVDSVAVCAGPWAGELLGPPFSEALKPYRQTLHWFPIDDEHREAWQAGPAFTWPHGTGGGDFFYGFPCLPSTGFAKVGTEGFAATTHPDVSVSIDENAARQVFERHLNGRLMGLHPTGAVSKSCQYTVTSDFQFVIDRHLHNENIWIVSACSGHGFKHSPAIGEAVAALVNRREPSVDLSGFTLDRLDLS